jgi:hypothetical protein
MRTNRRRRHLAHWLNRRSRYLTMCLAPFSNSASFTRELWPFFLSATRLRIGAPPSWHFRSSVWSNQQECQIILSVDRKYSTPETDTSQVQYKSVQCQCGMREGNDNGFYINSRFKQYIDMQPATVEDHSMHRQPDTRKKTLVGMQV